MENKTAEEILEPLTVTAYVDGYDYTVVFYGDAIRAMKQFASQERLKGITEGFNAAREIEEYRYSHDDTGKESFLASVEKYENINHYLNSNSKP